MTTKTKTKKTRWNQRVEKSELWSRKSAKHIFSAKTKTPTVSKTQKRKASIHVTALRSRSRTLIHIRHAPCIFLAYKIVFRLCVYFIGLSVFIALLHESSFLRTLFGVRGRKRSRALETGKNMNVKCECITTIWYAHENRMNIVNARFSSSLSVSRTSFSLTCIVLCCCIDTKTQLYQWTDECT